MKLATFILDGKTKVGVVDESAATLRAIEDRDRPCSISSRARRQPRHPGRTLPLAQVKLLGLILRPRATSFASGRNYREHAKEFANSGFEAGAVKGAEIDEYPAVFTKPASSVVGPDDDRQPASPGDIERRL